MSTNETLKVNVEKFAVALNHAYWYAAKQRARDTDLLTVIQEIRQQFQPIFARLRITPNLNDPFMSTGVLDLFQTGEGRQAKREVILKEVFKQLAEVLQAMKQSNLSTATPTPVIS